jgi:hypothetical protein
VATGKFLYPAWQFVAGRVVPGISAVREALGATNAWVFAGQLETIRSSDDGATRTLRELLVAGDVAGAVNAAKAAVSAHGGA